MWTLMVIAMMLPALLPAVRHVAANTLRWRRGRATLLFVAAYVSTWTVVGIAICLLSPLWAPAAGSMLAAGALLVAAAWQLTPFKRAALADCHRPVPLPPWGRRADAAVLRFGLLNSTSCVRSCWAMMLAMSLANTGMIVWMLVVTSMTTMEKRARRPRRATRVVAALLAAGAATVAIAT
jgi:predicted metal-binding membrane protein